MKVVLLLYCVYLFLFQRVYCENKLQLIQQCEERVREFHDSTVLSNFVKKIENKNFIEMYKWVNNLIESEPNIYEKFQNLSKSYIQINTQVEKNDKILKNIPSIEMLNIINDKNSHIELSDFNVTQRLENINKTAQNHKGKLQGFENINNRTDKTVQKQDVVFENILQRAKQLEKESNETKHKIQLFMSQCEDIQHKVNVTQEQNQMLTNMLEIIKNKQHKLEAQISRLEDEVKTLDLTHNLSTTHRIISIKYDEAKGREIYLTL